MHTCTKHTRITGLDLSVVCEPKSTLRFGPGPAMSRSGADGGDDDDDGFAFERPLTEADVVFGDAYVSSWRMEKQLRTQRQFTMTNYLRSIVEDSHVRPLRWCLDGVFLPRNLPFTAYASDASG